eukprot:10333243-Alexandrium_andersonii.AAC.1
MGSPSEARRLFWSRLGQQPRPMSYVANPHCVGRVFAREVLRGRLADLCWPLAPIAHCRLVHMHVLRPW